MSWVASIIDDSILMAISSRQEEKFQQFRPSMFFTGKMSMAPVMDGESSHAIKALKIQEDRDMLEKFQSSKYF